MSDNKIQKSKKARDIINRITESLDDTGVFYGHGTNDSVDEAVWLICHVADWSFDEIEQRLDDNLSDEQVLRIADLLGQRVKTRRPLAYVLNEAWFCGLKFYVDERVLVPRSLIGEFIEEGFQPWFDASEFETALDIGSGSGCIAIALATYFPKLKIDASDISLGALDVTRQNIEGHKLADRVNAIHSDLFSALEDKRYDLIVSNPPYVPKDDIDSFPKEYGHEPRGALESGEQGLNAVSIILEQGAGHLTDRGWLVVEVGETRERVEQAYPDLPLIWPSHSSGMDNVFFISAKDLKVRENKSV